MVKWSKPAKYCEIWPLIILNQDKQKSHHLLKRNK